VLGSAAAAQRSLQGLSLHGQVIELILDPINLYFSQAYDEALADREPGEIENSSMSLASNQSYEQQQAYPSYGQSYEPQQYDNYSMPQQQQQGFSLSATSNNLSADGDVDMEIETVVSTMPSSFSTHVPQQLSSPSQSQLPYSNQQYNNSYGYGGNTAMDSNNSNNSNSYSNSNSNYNQYSNSSGGYQSNGSANSSSAFHQPPPSATLDSANSLSTNTALDYDPEYPTDLVESLPSSSSSSSSLRASGGGYRSSSYYQSLSVSKESSYSRDYNQEREKSTYSSTTSSRWDDRNSLSSSDAMKFGDARYDISTYKLSLTGDDNSTSSHMPQKSTKERVQALRVFLKERHDPFDNGLMTIGRYEWNPLVSYPLIKVRFILLLSNFNFSYVAFCFFKLSVF
jgi:hypothetical protein